MAKEEVDRAIGCACNADSYLMLCPGRSPLYTSKIYRLQFIPMFTTTRVRLDRRRLSPELMSSSSSSQGDEDDDEDDRDEGDDMDQGNGGENANDGGRDESMG